MPPAGFTVPHAPISARRSSSASNLPRRLARSKPSTAEPRRSASARPSRAAVSGEIGRAAATTSSISRGVAVAVQGEIAAGGERLPRPLAEPAAERPHRQIVRDENAVKTDLAADDLRDQRGDKVAGARRIDRRVDDVRRHRPGHRGQRAKRHKIGRATVRHSRSRPTGRRDGCRPAPGHGRVYA